MKLTNMNSKKVQGDTSPHGLGWVDLDLECSTGRWAVLQLQIQVNPTQSVRRWVSLYTTQNGKTTLLSLCYLCQNTLRTKERRKDVVESIDLVGIKF